MEDVPGVVRNHVGRPRLKVYEQAISYLEKFVLPTNKFRSVVSRVEAVLKEQLELDSDAISVSMGPPSWDSFFKGLRFAVTDAPGRPHLPLERMGTGFTSMFVVALLRALVDTARGGSIFIIEEPETYLHEHFQEYAYNVLSELALRNQVIYTTHSK